MSTSNSTARTNPSTASFAVQRRRTIIACVNCRKRKIRCIPTEQPPKNPCARCTKKGLPCEYVTAEHEEDSHSSEPVFFNASREQYKSRSPSGAAVVVPGSPIDAGTPFAIHDASAPAQTSALFWDQLPGPIAVWIAIEGTDSPNTILCPFANQQHNDGAGIQSPGRAELPVHGELWTTGRPTGGIRSRKQRTPPKL
ncbi:hypothetical protein C8R45DRAFT_1094883 [Mycena sanguinolenta]|nr:hypothetical protein C8R45DRAFT_1094883 [Mycena sanguinolenta]